MKGALSTLCKNKALHTGTPIALGSHTEPRACGARLLVGVGAVAATQPDAAGCGQVFVVCAQRQGVNNCAEQSRVVPPVARLVLRG
mgnify:CR=1 FL=1